MEQVMARERQSSRKKKSTPTSKAAMDTGAVQHPYMQVRTREAESEAERERERDGEIQRLGRLSRQRLKD